VDNDDVKTMLLNVRRQVLEPYPFPEGSQVDPRYAMAIGLIAGICSEAVKAVQQGRQASFVIEAKGDERS
jgi:hypothetical protein